MTAIAMELPVNLPDATKSGKSKTAASKLQIRISQFINKMVTKFQRQYTYVLGFSYPIELIVAMLYDQTGRNRKWSLEAAILDCPLPVTYLLLTIISITPGECL